MAFLDTVADDLAGVMLAGDFSESVVIVQGSLSETVSGIFDLTYAETAQNGQTVQAKNPRVSIASDTLDALGFYVNDDAQIRDWLFTVRGVVYNVNRTERDGLGVMVFYLRRAKV